MKNYASWNVLHYLWDSLTHFESNWNGISGVHTIQFDEGINSIDIYVNTNVKNTDFTVLPVIFSGAVSKRNGAAGPFFTGLKMSERSGFPLVSIADPTLDSDSSLTLGWYLGGKQSNVQKNMVDTLDTIQKVMNRELLLVGGSGGGFAALSLAKQLMHSCSVLVWNPQTDVYSYSERFVKQYLRSQFNFSNATLQREDWKDYCTKRTNLVIQTNILDEKTLTAPRRIVYLQNKTDSHRETHLLPLWKISSDIPLTDGKNILDENHVVYVAEFADGHLPPSNILIGEVIQELSDKSAKSANLKSLSNYA